MENTKIIPCKDKGEYRQFGWYNKTLKPEQRLYHLGDDRNCDAGDDVYALLDGVVICSAEVSGFGSFGRMGGVVIVESTFNDCKYSILYGHIIRNVKINTQIKKGDLLGNVIRYQYKDGKEIIRADHLHWGVWVGGGLPQFDWGYEIEIDCRWISPINFRESVLSKEV